MRVLIVGDACVDTGFARCTHALADALHADGHEAAVMGINYWGDPHGHPYPVYPTRAPREGLDALGWARLPHLVARLRPDVVVLLSDPWNISGYVRSLEAGLPRSVKRPALVGWLAVDGKNQLAAGLNVLDRVVVWTEFAAKELVLGGYTGPLDVAPLGVDVDRYRPLCTKAEARVALGMDTERAAANFLIGVVGRNQPRKRLDLALASFAAFLEEYPEDAGHAALHLHCAPTGEAAFNLRALSRYYGLHNSGRVTLSEPTIAHGIAEGEMPVLYNALDVLLSTCQGEGWNLPAIEAMACGVPVVVPKFAASGSLGWMGDAAVAVPCSAESCTAPLEALHTVGAVPSPSAVARALRDLVRSPEHRATHAARGLRLAARPEFRWPAVGRAVAAVVLEAAAGAPGPSRAAERPETEGYPAVPPENSPTAALAVAAGA